MLGFFANIQHPTSSIFFPMNYFNYFTEIEDTFVSRRGKHLLVSPLDWSLMESWQQRGIPLRIVLRGITKSFDTYDQQPRKAGRLVNNLLYCQQAVEEAYHQYLESQVGGREEGDETKADEVVKEAPFSLTSIKLALDEWLESMVALRMRFSEDAMLAEAFDRAANRLQEISEDLNQLNDDFLGALDADLNLIEAFLLEGIKNHTSEERIAELRKEGEKDLKSYRKGMEREVYEQTLNNWVARKLRDEYHLPRLSLFYL
jgi:hypothetical protein